MPGPNEIRITQIETACGGKMEWNENIPSAMYHGKTVYFCMKSCLKAFQSDPDRFMAGEIEHPAEEE